MLDKRNMKKTSMKFEWFAAVCLIFLITTILGSADGGIDIDRYWTQANFFDIGSFYYAKEMVAWNLIGLASDFSDRDQFLLTFFVCIMLIYLTFSYKNFPFFIFACCSFFAVLLFANILRQGIASALFVISINYLLKDENYKWILFSILSCLAHNTFVILFIVTIFVKVVDILPIRYKYAFTFFMVLFGGYALYFMVVAIDGQDFSDISHISEGIHNYIYGLIAGGICLAWYIFSDGPEKILAISLLFMITAIFAICYYLDVPGWVPGRIATSLSFIALTFVYILIAQQKLAIVVYAIGIAAGMASIYFHPGAYSMLFDI